ncbi:MAG: type II secretion system protein N [Rhodocyclaceae bacterium]|nr:type II secretion system protein N [Rhodocyclaceae bacterium]
MIWRLLLFALAVVVLVLWRMPATVLDSALAGASDGRLRLLDARGSVWSGSGTLASLSGDGRAAQPWLQGHWRTEFGGLASGWLGWWLREQDRTVAHLRFSAGGIELVSAELDTPLGPLLDSVPHPLARAGWRGATRLTTPGIRCDWLGACAGPARLVWTDAGVDLVPGRRFGDYELRATARGRSGTLSLRTLSGELRIDGEGSWNEQRRLRFDGRVEGPVEIVGRLPNVMDGIALPTDSPTVAEIRLR